MPSGSSGTDSTGVGAAIIEKFGNINKFVRSFGYKNIIIKNPTTEAQKENAKGSNAFVEESDSNTRKNYNPFQPTGDLIIFKGEKWKDITTPEGRAEIIAHEMKHLLDMNSGNYLDPEIDRELGLPHPQKEGASAKKDEHFQSLATYTSRKPIADNAKIPKGIQKDLPTKKKGAK